LQEIIFNKKKINTSRTCSLVGKHAERAKKSLQMLRKRKLSAYIFPKLPGVVELEIVDLLFSILVSIAVEVVVDKASGMAVVVGVNMVVVDECDDEDEELVDREADI